MLLPVRLSLAAGLWFERPLSRWLPPDTGRRFAVRAEGPRTHSLTGFPALGRSQSRASAGARELLGAAWHPEAPCAAETFSLSPKRCCWQRSVCFSWCRLIRGSRDGCPRRTVCSGSSGREPSIQEAALAMVQQHRVCPRGGDPKWWGPASRGFWNLAGTGILAGHMAASGEDVAVSLACSKLLGRLLLCPAVPTWSGARSF